MQNKKIVVIAIAAILVVLLAVVSVVAITSGGGKDKDEPTSSDNSVSIDDNNNNTIDGGTSDDTASDNLSELILGTWRDSANMSGYAFYADGTVEMTYVNLTVPVINLPINGTSKGTYTLEGDKLTTTFSIYSASIVNEYTVTVEDNILKLYDLEEKETSTYAKVVGSVDGAPVGDITDETGLVGIWTVGEGSQQYVFSADGTVTVTKKGITNSGVYLAEDNSLTIQYFDDGDKYIEKYTYRVSNNMLILETENDSTIYVRTEASGQTNPSGNSGGILGVWRDGSGMSGYEFKEGGIVEITYVNFTVPVINMPINGTYTGSYSINGSEVSITFSLYGNNVSQTYNYTVENNTLRLENSDGEILTYIRQ